jgi:hypothetical protein
MGKRPVKDAEKAELSPPSGSGSRPGSEKLWIGSLLVALGVGVVVGLQLARKERGNTRPIDVVGSRLPWPAKGPLVYRLQGVEPRQDGGQGAIEVAAQPGCSGSGRPITRGIAETPSSLQGAFPRQLGSCGLTWPERARGRCLPPRLTCAACTRSCPSAFPCRPGRS